MAKLNIYFEYGTELKPMLKQFSELGIGGQGLPFQLRLAAVDIAAAIESGKPSRAGFAVVENETERLMKIGTGTLNFPPPGKMKRGRPRKVDKQIAVFAYCGLAEHLGQGTHAAKCSATEVFGYSDLRSAQRAFNDGLKHLEGKSKWFRAVILNPDNQAGLAVVFFTDRTEVETDYQTPGKVRFAVRAGWAWLEGETTARFGPHSFSVPDDDAELIARHIRHSCMR
jgi:hypothetical protein